MGGREGGDGEGLFGENKAALNLKKTAHYISSHNLHTSWPIQLWFPSLRAFSLQKILQTFKSNLKVRNPNLSQFTIR